MRVLVLLVALALAGCSLPLGDKHCGEVRRRTDDAWFLPTARASSPLPAWEARVESEAWRAWNAAYAPSACGTAVRMGDPEPWLGPVLHAGERDAIAVLLVNHTDANVVGGTWRVTANASSASVRVEPASWEGGFHETAHVAFVVEAVADGSAIVLVDVVGPGGGPVTTQPIQYLVASGVEGPPHRLPV